MDHDLAAAVVDEAVKRAGLIWVRRQGAPTPPRPLWFAWVDGDAYVLTGGWEQPAPEGLAAEDQAEVSITSKDNRSRLITALATVEVVAPTSADWDAVVPALRSNRLNLEDPAQAAARWATESTLWRLRFAGQYLV